MVGYSVGIDGVGEDFYLSAGTQGKGCSHSIIDEVSTRERGFSWFSSHRHRFMQVIRINARSLFSNNPPLLFNTRALLSNKVPLLRNTRPLFEKR